MTGLSEEILRKHQVRMTAQQKRAFEDLLRERFPELQTEEGTEGELCRNLILGDPETAQIVFGAHYDTCAEHVFPNLIVVNDLPLTVLGMLIAAVGIVCGGVLAMKLVLWLGGPVPLAMAVYFAVLLLLVTLAVRSARGSGGRPNTHTANDNTSGVIALVELYEHLTPAQRERAAFVFFDNEEKGLLGSRLFLREHERMKETVLVNLDSLSDGDELLVICPDRARETGKRMASCPCAPGKNVRLLRRERCCFPSDQRGYPLGIAAAAAHPGPLGFYLSKIHTRRDVVFDEENIEWFCRAAASLLS